MSLIIAARFPSFTESGKAASQLLGNGFADDDIHTFYVTPAGAHAQTPIGGDEYQDPGTADSPLGAMLGAALLGLIFAIIGGWIAAQAGGATFIMLAAAGVGGYLGALLGSLWLSGQRRKRQPSQRAPGLPAQAPAGVMLAVRTAPDQEIEVRRILKDAGGAEIERAHGRWVDGQWQDFDPVAETRRTEHLR